METTEHNYFRSLHEIAAAVNSISSPEDILHSIVENVARVLGAKGCALMLLTPNRKILVHSADCGLSDRYLRKGPISADKSIAQALEGKPVAILDATKDKRIQYREEAKQEGIASMLSVPVRLRDEVIGVIRVYTAEPRQFTEDDIYFVSAVANLGAIALENARLYASLQRDYNALKHYYFPFL